MENQTGKLFVVLFMFGEEWGVYMNQNNDGHSYAPVAFMGEELVIDHFKGLADVIRDHPAMLFNVISDMKRIKATAVDITGKENISEYLEEYKGQSWIMKFPFEVTGGKINPKILEDHPHFDIFERVLFKRAEESSIEGLEGEEREKKLAELKAFKEASEKDPVGALADLLRKVAAKYPKKDAEEQLREEPANTENSEADESSRAGN